MKVLIVLTIELNKMIEEYAKEHDMNKSQVVRAALRKFFADEESK